MNIRYAIMSIMLAIPIVVHGDLLRGSTLQESDNSSGMSTPASGEVADTVLDVGTREVRKLATSGDKRACLEVTAGRTGLVTLLRNLASSGKTISYSQDSIKRWSGIKNWICPVNNKVPTYADCSSFVSWVFWTAYGLGEDKLNGQTWTGGYTGTMATRGVQVSKATTVNGVKKPASYTNAQPGDIVLYGSPHVHVAIYIGNGQVANFGSTGPVKILSINFHPSKVEQIRSFIGSAATQF